MRKREPNRRRFLFGMLGAFAAGLVVEAVGIVLSYLSPVRGEEGGGPVKCGLVSDYAPGDVRLIAAARLFIVRRDDGFLALSQKCTHLGCLVPWDESAGRFLCPCHGGAFDRDGLVRGGPPPRPLDLVELQIVDGELIADTSRPRPRAEWDAEQVVRA